MEQDCYVCENEIFQSSLDGLWYMRIQGSGWDNYNDCMEYTDILINYCYECGKKYSTAAEIIEDQLGLPPKNPNKRDCVSKNITFSVQQENEKLIRSLK